MGDENFTCEIFINFLKFMKLWRGNFWKFHWNVEVELFVKNKHRKIDRNSWNHPILSYL